MVLRFHKLPLNKSRGPPLWSVCLQSGRNRLPQIRRVRILPRSGSIDAPGFLVSARKACQKTVTS